MIQNEDELKFSYETIAKLHRLRDESLIEPLWDDQMREQVVVGIEGQIQKIEKEISEFLAKRPSKVA